MLSNFCIGLAESEALSFNIWDARQDAPAMRSNFDQEPASASWWAQKKPGIVFQMMHASLICTARLGHDRRSFT